jgi:ketosteroid isomerase-like protein
MSQENVELVRTGLDAANREDIAAIIALTHPDIEFVALVADVEGRTYHGYDGIRQYFVDMHDAWIESEYEVEDLIDAASDRVVALVRWRAAGRTSGIRVDAPLAAVYSFRDGRIYRMIVFQSRADALQSVRLSD